MRRRHKNPLPRQMQEATEIECSKGEFNGPRVPRVVIEVGARTMTRDDGSQPGHQPQQPNQQP